MGRALHALAMACALVAAATATASANAGPAPAVPTAAAAPTSMAIVVRDPTALRAAPHESAQQQALLWQGEVVEVRGERIDHLQVWDYRRERGGFVDASRVRRTSLAASEAPELLAVLRFVRGTPGSEALGIGFAAAWLKAAPAQAVLGLEGAEAFDAIGTMADRLAQRASGPAAAAMSTSLSSLPVIAAAPSRPRSRWRPISRSRPATASPSRASSATAPCASATTARPFAAFSRWPRPTRRSAPAPPSA